VNAMCCANVTPYIAQKDTNRLSAIRWTHDPPHRLPDQACDAETDRRMIRLTQGYRWLAQESARRSVETRFPLSARSPVYSLVRIRNLGGEILMTGSERCALENRKIEKIGDFWTNGGISVSYPLPNSI